jgi:indole-3-acetate monooxygenase
MSSLLHPSAFLPSEMLTTIRKHAAQAEESRQLHEEQMKLIYARKLFKMFVPARYGGLALALPDVLRTEEALAWADGSTAWVVTLCSGAGWFVGFLDPGLAKQVFQDEKVCLAGSGAPTGTAEIVSDGFIINGEWKYASGSLHATVFTANCRMMKEGVALRDEQGEHQIKSFLFFKDEVSLQKSWNSMGMVATASHSFAIKERRVPSNRAFVIDKKGVILTDPVYQYPFLQLAETTLAVNLSGMAQRFLDLAGVIFDERTGKDQLPSKNIAKLLEQSQSALRSCRREFYDAVEASWSVCESDSEIPAHLLERVSDMSYQLYLASLSEVHKLYRYSGLRAADVREEINRVWRNLYTASQHSLFSGR